MQRFDNNFIELSEYDNYVTYVGRLNSLLEYQNFFVL